MSSKPKNLLNQVKVKNGAVLVTGAAHRIGRAIALSLGKAGWRIALHYNSSKIEAYELRRQIRRAGGSAEVLQADLSEARDVQALLPRAMQLVGPINVLVNNASVYEWDDLHSFSDETWSQHMNVNLRAPLVLCQAFDTHLPKCQAGVIINMLDSRVLTPSPRHLTYSLAKSALWTLTRSLAPVLAPRIRINGIGPGPTLPWRGQTDDDFAQRCEHLPLKAPASLQEICDAVDFLISTNSLTGQIISLDGGDHLVRKFHSVDVSRKRCPSNANLSVAN
jgi:NAD(P)-dependent dehydrogenase (short-subunit alcohol dehydrogenase family)